MEAWTTTLEPGAGWRHLGSTPEKDEAEVIVRALDAPVLFATGTKAAAPDVAPVTVVAGEGSRLSGFHFFAKAVDGGSSTRIVVRGV